MKVSERKHVNAFGDVIYSPMDVLSDRVLSKLLRRIFTGICHELGTNTAQAEEIANILWLWNEWPSIESFESHLRQQFNRFISQQNLTSAFEKRALLIAKQVRPFLVGDSIADVGSGDGLVAWLLRDIAKRIELVDVDFYLDPRVSLPFYQCKDGKPLPIKEAVDTSLLLTVLHHASDPISLLKQTSRTTLSRLVIIESVIGVKRSSHAPKSYLYDLDMNRQRKYATFIDWLYNRVLHKDVRVPYNYLTPRHWKKVFESHGLNVVEVIDLGVDQAIVPEHHVLFALDKA
jgi:hypothetical protein